MDGVSGAASIIAVIGISANITSLCVQYSASVKNAKKDIERLQRKVSDIRNVLEEVRQLLDGRDKMQSDLSDSLKECLLHLEDLKTQLEPGKTHKAMSRVGFRALKWPFTSKEVEKHIASLESYEKTCTLALTTDLTGIMRDVSKKMNLVDKKTDNLHQKIGFAKLPIAEGASFDSHLEEHNAQCLANTRVELQRQIKEWADDKNGKLIFWLSGMAGTGKSTIARTIARSFADKRQLGASFFFKKGESDRGTAGKFFTTIAGDLMAHVPEVTSGITAAIDADPAISQKALQIQFENLILKPLSETVLPKALGLIVVIDALDECERGEDVRVILQLLSRTKDLKSVSLRVFVTCRPELRIRIGFKQMSDGTYQSLTLHEVSKENVEHDMTVFFKHEFAKIRQERPLPLEWPEETNIKILVGMATPLFIFAATICRFVGDPVGNPRRRLNDILKYETKDMSQLEMTYLPILDPLFAIQDEREKQKLSREFTEIVGSIVVLETSLSIASLANLLDIPKEDISCRLDSLNSVLSIPLEEELPVRLLHSSFREFLLDTQKRGKSFWVDEEETHKRLASKCLELMSSSKGLRPNMCNLKRPGTLRSEINNQVVDNALSPEVQYACRYWVRHLEQSKGRIRDGDEVHAFLQKNFLYWLEALSLMRKSSENIHMINSLQSLIDAEGNTAIVDFLCDGKRFVLQNRRPLEIAPLQLYSSGLIFAPKMSIIRKLFDDHIPIWVTRLPMVEEDWNALLQPLEWHPGSVRAVAFSPDSQLVASASENMVVLWGPGIGSSRSVLEGHLDLVRAIAFSPDGQLLASASEDKTVRLWDTGTRSCRSTLKGHSKCVRAVAFSPDNQLVASGSGDKTVRLWDAGTGSCRSTLEGHMDSVRSVAFSPDSQLVASASDDNTVRLWDVRTRSCRSTLEGHFDLVGAVTFSSDGQLVASGSDDNTVRLWDVDTGSCRSMLEGHLHSVNAVAFSPDGQLIASASDDSTVRLWDSYTGTCRSTLEGHSSQVSDVAFSPDGQLLASASWDNTVRLWDTETGSYRITLEGHSNLVMAVAFSSDGKLVASASDDNTVRLWDAGARTCRNTLEGHSGLVSAVAFSPDGQLVASASEDKTIRLWDAGTGSCHSTLEEHSDVVRSIAFSPDGSYLNTDRGQTSILLSRCSTSYRQVKELFAISVEGMWIAAKDQRFLWLPVDYRPRCTAVCGSVICLGRASGHLTFLEFNFESMSM